MFKFGWIILTVIQCIFTKKQAEFPVTLKDQKLHTPNQWIKHGLEKGLCFAQCLFSYKECHSINIHKEKDICVVNYNVTEETKQSNFIEEDGWIYYEKKVSVYSK